MYDRAFDCFIVAIHYNRPNELVDLPKHHSLS